jgi:DNA polymerase (family X)
MDNRDYARILHEIALLKQINGDNPFKVRAFETVARSIEGLTSPLDDLLKDPAFKLTDLDGVGDSIADDLQQLHDSGSCEIHSRLLNKLHPGLLTLARIQGLGPKRLKTLWDTLHIHSLDDLAAAARDQKLRALPGFGPKTETTILSECERLLTDSDRTPLPLAHRWAEDFIQNLLPVPGVQHIQIAGSIRRGRESVGDIDLLVAYAPDDSTPLMHAATTATSVAQILAHGPKKSSVRLNYGPQLDVRVIHPDAFGAALHYFTGSKEHHVKLRARAKQLGMRINEYGVWRELPDGSLSLLAAATEQEVFAAVGLPYIPPELREGLHEIEDALAGRLPDLVTHEQIRGDLHMHTTASDGDASVLQMAQAARALGLDYIVITDHSQTLTVANGLTPQRFAAHIAHIREVDADAEGLLGGLRVLPGLEVDILKDGSLDMDPDLLRDADWIVGSVHQHMNMPPEAMTERLLTAIQTGLLSSIGHPTGRLLGGRAGFQFDLDAVMIACREHGVAMELNGSSGRLDLNADLARRAKELGTKLVLGSDAHNTRDLVDLRFATTQARRAGLTAADVVNTGAAPLRK